ncbi:RNA polymerase recycling motor HelD [Paenibacillus donghaensis]|uniref:Helicase n=1 Tax=Paenibacillus donghaensis TaxID=414771 RepID=A0A2Z2K4K6_9BACL|nr:RNA polymerase recycling motor HelD [Paenibacillus donghaensis]ASA20786.1 helicase [Paenibacillus donghaensis]
MSAEFESRDEEQKRVDEVVGEIDKQAADLAGELGQKKTDIVEFRKNFWEEVSLNFEDAGTYASLKQQTEILSENERTYQLSQKKLHTLTRLKQSPYFGRIDFRDGDARQPEVIYLGIASLLAANGLDFLVYDWRAPVSNLYYDYSPGPARYDTPSGVIEGDMTLKRQYVIRNGRIESMFDASLTIGDELLQEVLGQQANSQMRSIVATIQKEQNLIIRDVTSQLLIVQGAAGSGKTSAALQRAAYLLYRFREHLRADQIVLFSPNHMFNSYVATVLPELGEDNMAQTTFQEYLAHRIGSLFQLEDPFQQMEYILSGMSESDYAQRIEGIQWKASKEFMLFLEHYVDYLGHEGMLFQDIIFRDEILLSAQTIEDQFYTYASSLRLPNRLGLLSEWLLKELKKQAIQEREKPWVEDEMELLDREEYNWAYQELQKQERLADPAFSDSRSERDILAARIVDVHFRPLQQDIQQFAYVDIPGIYLQLFASLENLPIFNEGLGLPQHWQAICKHTVGPLDQAKLLYEDATPFLYLTECIEGFQTNNTIRHVFIDEAQDFSTFQFMFIKRLFPRSRMTVLGDWNQRIFIHDQASEDTELLQSLYGDDNTQSVRLTRSYRSTQPIIEFTRASIPGGQTIEAFDRQGNKPTVKQVRSTDGLIAQVLSSILELQNKGHRTIAIICKTANESIEAHRALQAKLPIRLVEKETAAFAAGIIVIPAYLAKGIEFDAVVIYDASQHKYGQESERKLFYTACTRAMHDLHVCLNGDFNPFLSDVPPHLYHLIQ